MWHIRLATKLKHKNFTLRMIERNAGSKYIFKFWGASIINPISNVLQPSAEFEKFVPILVFV
jgi:hypothetical protein